MSYALMPRRVNIDALKSYYGCKDEARLAKLLADPDIASEIAEYAEEHEDEIADGMPPLEQALRNIIFGQTGRTTPKDSMGQHVRALELLVDACGGWSLDNNEASPMPSAWVFGIKPLCDLVYASGPPVPIPNGDDLIAGHMSAAAVVSKLAEIATADVADLVEGRFLASLDKLRRAEVERILGRYKAWLIEAKDAKQGIVVFAW